VITRAALALLSYKAQSPFLQESGFALWAELKAQFRIVCPMCLASQSALQVRAIIPARVGQLRVRVTGPSSQQLSSGQPSELFDRLPLGIGNRGGALVQSNRRRATARRGPAPWLLPRGHPFRKTHLPTAITNSSPSLGKVCAASAISMGRWRGCRAGLALPVEMHRESGASAVLALISSTQSPDGFAISEPILPYRQLAGGNGLGHTLTLNHAACRVVPAEPHDDAKNGSIRSPHDSIGTRAPTPVWASWCHERVTFELN